MRNMFKGRIYTKNVDMIGGINQHKHGSSVLPVEVTQQMNIESTCLFECIDFHNSEIQED